MLCLKTVYKRLIKHHFNREKSIKGKICNKLPFLYFSDELENGQFLIVEHKGEHLWSNDDSQEKRAVGELWAERSGGRGIFVMPKGRQYTAIADAIRRKSA